MAAYVRWNDVVGRLEGDEKYIALALVLLPFADPKTGRLPTSPATLMRGIFGSQGDGGRINYSLQEMKQRGLLVNRNPEKKAPGEWYLHLPKSVKPEIVHDIALLRAATEFVERFGKNRIPDFIALLETFHK